MNTFNSFLIDTVFTLLFMTLFLGGMAILGMKKALKDKIIFSKKELLKKGEYYSPLQMMLASLIFLFISLWYSFYEGNIFEYIDKAQALFRESKVDFELKPIGYILLFIFIFIALFGSSFSKVYADKKKDFYVLEFNKYDKFGGVIAFTMIGIMIYSDYQNINELHEKLIALIFFLMGLSIFLYTRITIYFNDQYIVFYTFWRAKRTVFWEDVKEIKFEEKNNDYIRLTTKSNKKFIIPARVNGLVSFMSTFKTKNK